jgi:Zn-dependent protease
VEECVACGAPASKALYTWDVRGGARAIPVCGRCYEEYSPVVRRGSVELRPRRRVSHTGYMIWKIESKGAARLIERLGRTWLGRLASWISIASIPLVFASLAIALWSLVDRALNPARYIWFVKALPRGAMAIGIPGLDPAIPLIQGWIAIFITAAVHELAHGLASTWLGTPPRGAGVILLLGIPIAAYVDISANPYEGGSWRFTGAGLAANLLTSAAALAMLALTGMPGIYLEKPILLLIPPEVAGYLGLDVGLGFTQSLLAWIFFMNLWGAFFNALPLLATDGYYLFVSMLSRAAGRSAARPALIFSTALILSIAAVLLIERLLIPHGII